MEDSEREEARAVRRLIHGWQVELSIGAVPDHFTSQFVHLFRSVHKKDAPGFLTLGGPIPRRVRVLHVALSVFVS